jgi:hypothetical protein
MTPLATLSVTFAAVRGVAAAAFVFGTTALKTDDAAAYSLQVKMACASDYFSHCSQHAVGSPEVRQCMRAAGPQLSKRCVTALVASGEVSQTEVSRRSASLR